MACALEIVLYMGGLSRKKEGEYKKYYMELLIILLLYTFKINEELNYNQIYNDPQ